MNILPRYLEKEAAGVVIAAKGDEFAITLNESILSGGLMLQRLNISIKFLRLSGCLTLSGL